MYPLFLKLENTLCLVIGGGTVAERKTISLLEAGAQVTLISPDVTDQLGNLIDQKRIVYKNRLFEQGDTKGFFLIIAATNSSEVNEVIYGEAALEQSLINCVDEPRFCNFYVPAQIKRGSLKIAVSTEGKLPLLAGRIRKLIDSLFPRNLGDKLNELGDLRRTIISEAGDDEERKMKMFNEQLIPSIDCILEDIGK